MMRCTELVKNANKSVVEIRNMETDKIVKYVVCSNFDNSKAYGNKWDSGEYYSINDAVGLHQQDMLRAAIFDLYGIKEPKIPYDRAMEFARAFFNNMDIDDEQAETLKDIYHITEIEAEEFGIKDKLFARKYKVVEVYFKRTQYATVKVIMPEDVENYEAEDYVENQCYLEENESDDWECEDYNVLLNDLSEGDIKRDYDLDEIWNGCDFPDNI